MVVEDEEPLALLLRYNLEAEGYTVDVVHRGDEAEVAIAEGSPDLIVLDWMLPGLSGLELCRRLRTGKDSRTIPIILLTARSEESDRIRGLTTGADDYVVKPFSLPELMARVRAILRRTNPERIASVLSVGDIELDRDSHRVTRNGRQVHLGPTEFRLLEFLMRLAVARHYRAGKAGGGHWTWRAGGLLVQKLTREGGQPQRRRLRGGLDACQGACRNGRRP